MFALIVYAIVFVVGVITGAYSHKWLARVSGAPANLTVSTIGKLPAEAVQAAKAVATDVAKKV